MPRIDIHADHVLVQGNMVIDSFVGMKAMHGSRYVLIANNHFSKSVLWAIGLMPGASSKVGNEDGDSIVTGNIDTGPGGPLNLTVSDDDLFPTGTEGVQNR